MRRGSKLVVAADLSELSSMKGTLKDVDRALDVLNDSVLIMHKFKAVLDARGLTKKVDEASKMELESLIGKLEKVNADLFNYSVKLNSIKELN